MEAAIPNAPASAQHLTDQSDWNSIAEWCNGRLGTEDGEPVIHTTIGPAHAGSWIVATPGGQFSHAVYADKDYRGFLALLARRSSASAGTPGE